MTLAKPDYCRPCQIFGNGRGFIQPTGSNRVPLILVGEGGGGTEEKQGKPFVGAAGQVLERAIRMSGLKRDDYTITNLLSCRPPGNLLLKQPYERPALDHCRKYLNDVVAERRPRIMLALGEIPLRELTGGKHSQSSARGYVLDSIYPDVKVIGTFHPSRILRGDWHLFGVLMHDLRRAVSYATHGVPAPLPTAYNLYPSVDAVQRYIDQLHSNPNLPIAYDIETKGIFGTQEPEGEETIVQIQFSSEAGTALVLPYKDPYIDLAKEIMALPNLKMDWFGRGFDRKVLNRHGFVLNGELHDLMDAWGALQPGFLSQKDAGDTEDKGIPSRLMSLQSCVSFYYPNEGLWKNIVAEAARSVGPGLGAYHYVMQLLRWYGARDVDFSVRVGLKMFESLRQNGQWDAYYNFKYKLAQVLDDLSVRGLPIDVERQTALRESIEAEEKRLLWPLQQMAGEELQRLHPEFGYVKTPKWVDEAVSNGYDALNPPLIELSNSHGYLVQRMVTAEVVNKVEIDCSTCEGTGGYWGKKKWCKCQKCKGTGKRWQKDGKISRDELRWCLAFFNPNSHDQVLDYIRHQGYRVPIDVDSKKPTTNKTELTKLAMETNDTVLFHILKTKKVAKLRDYCSGSWIPGQDGRVHAQFRFGSATGQTSAVRPPVQTYPEHYDPKDKWMAEIMKRVKATIKAEPGHVLVKVDMRGFHARTQAWLAEDPVYYRMSDIDAHSYTTAFYVGEPDANELAGMDDARLRSRLKEIKTKYNFERNYQVKRVTYCMQYGGQAEKAFSILSGFDSVLEVEMLMRKIRNDVFPVTFTDYPKAVERQLRRSPRLQTPFGCVRYIWDSDILQATAFGPSNCAHCHIQLALIRLYEAGAFSKYNAVNFTHDALWYMPPLHLQDECIAVTKAEFERPSEVLVNSLGPFFCHADQQAGDDMASVEDV